MSELKIFEEREVLGKEFRIYGTPDEPLFLAKDVAEWIEYDVSNSYRLVQSVDESERLHTMCGTLGGNQEAWFLTEDGLYEVLMQSRKPIAKQFKAEVKVILKTIRKHGMYATGETLEKLLSDPDSWIRLLTELKSERETRIETERANHDLKQTLDVLEEANSVIRIGDLAYEIRRTGVKLGSRRLFAWMRNNGYVTRTQFGYVPTDKSVENGWLVERKTCYRAGCGAITQATIALVTVKGQRYFTDLWKNGVSFGKSEVSLNIET